MSSNNLSLIINEIYPNPSTGSEWVEIYQVENDSAVQAEVYTNYSLNDNYHLIYQFTGEEVWTDQFLVINVSGLNNDGDSVILKDDLTNILDQMTYSSSQKDQSWSRVDPTTNEFLLTPISPLADNLLPNPSASPTTQPDPTPTTNVSPQLTPQVSESPTPTINLSTNQQKTEQIKKNLLIQQFDPIQHLSNYQNLTNLQLKTINSDLEKNQSRLVFLGQKILKKVVLNAIIGSSLLIVAAILFSYEQKESD